MKIRKAVGAIVKTGNRFILIHKVKIMNSKNGPEDTLGRWDFPKGGVKSSDMNLNEAILRELKEETGSDQYKIITEFDEKISFKFPPDIQEKLGYQKQEVTMFLVEYTGDESDLQPQDEEIDNIALFSRDEVVDLISHKEPLEFFEKYIPNINL